MWKGPVLFSWADSLVEKWLCVAGQKNLICLTEFPVPWGPSELSSGSRALGRALEAAERGGETSEQGTT